jgi:hypothetical protein
VVILVVLPLFTPRAMLGKPMREKV